MPTINISGQPAGGNNGGNGGRGRPSESRQGAPGSRPTESRDYDRAEAQQARQAGQEARQRRQEDAAWRRHEASEARYRREMDRLRDREIRDREKEIRQREQRATADQRIQHRFGMLQHRSQSPLTPSSWNAWQRAHATLTHQARLHEQRYGSTPFSTADLRALRASTGDERTSFGVGRTLRLGNVGQARAYEGRWTELHRIERELRHIEKTLEKTEKFAASPAAQANLVRQRDALLTARNRINAGLEGTSGVQQITGRGIGLLGSAMRNPVVDSATAALVFGLEAPYAGNMLVSSIYGQGRRYRDWAVGLRRMGAAGGFSGQALENRLLNSGPSSLIPGSGLPAELKRFGLSPESAARIMAARGVAFHDDKKPVTFAEQAQLMSYAPGMNLSPETLAQLSGQAHTLGGSQVHDTRYWDKLLKIQRLATREGLDNSRIASSRNHARRGVRKAALVWWRAPPHPVWRWSGWMAAAFGVAGNG